MQAMGDVTSVALMVAVFLGLLAVLARYHFPRKSQQSYADGGDGGSFGNSSDHCDSGGGWFGDGGGDCGGGDGGGGGD